MKYRVCYYKQHLFRTWIWDIKYKTFRRKDKMQKFVEKVNSKLGMFVDEVEEIK